MKNTKILVDKDSVLKILSDLLEGHELEYSTWKINNLPIHIESKYTPEIGKKYIVGDLGGSIGKFLGFRFEFESGTIDTIHHNNFIEE